jgi:cytoskeletal protein RodZ
MLLEELSRNKRAMAGFIIVALCIIYIISKKFLFRTILGRLLLVIGLVATTNYNKMMGIGLLILICLAYSQMSNDFENMENPASNPNSTSSSASSSSPSLSSTLSSKLSSIQNPTSTSSPSSNSTSSSIPSSNPTSTSTPTTPDIATIEEKKRNMITGKNVNSLPIPPKDSAKDVSGTSGVKETFLGYSRF